MTRRGLLGLMVVGWLGILIHQSAWAVPPPPKRFPGMLGGLCTTEPTVLEVHDEQFRMTCVDRGENHECQFEVLYHIRNPNTEPARAIAAFYAIRGRDLVVTVDGESVTRDLSPEEIESLDRVLGSTLEPSAPHTFFEGVPPDVASQVTRLGIVLQHEPGQSRAVSVHGRLELGESSRTSWVRSAVRTRHLLLASEPDGVLLEFDYLMSSPQCFSELGPVEATVRYPASWLFQGGLTDDTGSYTDVLGLESGEPWHEDTDEEDAQVTATFEGGVGTRVMVSFSRPGPPFLFGGVLLAFGGAVDDSGGFRTRVGIEVAAPDWLLHAINIDTDWSKRFMVTPTVIAATSSPLFLPIGFGIGLGIPVQVHDDFEVGVRAQVDMTLGPLGFVTSFDLFPWRDSDDPDRLQVVMMGQVSF